LLFAAFAAALAGCAATPVPNVYVLSAPAPTTAGDEKPAGAQVLLLEAVLIPGFLDSTDIQWRIGPHELRTSPTGRWAERLSQAITQALRDDLDARLATANVVLAGSGAAFGRRVRIDVDGFDAWPDGRCVLTAGWSILDRDARSASTAGRVRVATGPRTAEHGDAAVVAAMADAVDALAERIASAASRLPPPAGASVR
jgi:uncharacterized lipoprotein YmbA